MKNVKKITSETSKCGMILTEKNNHYCFEVIQYQKM
jgi:hypothetical protein